MSVNYLNEGKEERLEQINGSTLSSFKNQTLKNVDTTLGAINLEDLKENISYMVNDNEINFNLIFGGKKYLIGYVDLNFSGKIPSIDFISNLNSSIDDYNHYDMDDWVGMIHNSILGFKIYGLIEYMYKVTIEYVKSKGYNKIKGSVSNEEIYRINRKLLTLGYVKSIENKGKYFIRYI